MNASETDRETAVPLRERARYTAADIARVLGTHAPTPEQTAIIEADLSPLLVVAGAGSGKTATMVDRVVWLVVNGFVRPEEVLGVTFTNKAAGELRHRMVARLQLLRDRGLRAPDEDPEEPALDPTVSTYHAYAKNLVTEYGLHLGIEKDVVLLGQAQRYQLAAQIVEQWEGTLPEQNPAKSTLVQAVLAMSGECAEHLVTAEQVAQYCDELREHLLALPSRNPAKAEPKGSQRRKLVQRLETKILVATLTARFQAVKRTMQVMDFGDLLAYAATMARGIGTLREEQRGLYRVVLLDEFQDTSHAQMVLFSLVFGDGHSVMAVGDPKQSIYGFRGASEGQLFDFYRWFPSEHREPAYLSTAWRNGLAVLEAANTVARPLSRRAPWVRGTVPVGVPDLVPAPGAVPARVLAGTWASDAEEAAGVADLLRARMREAPEGLTRAVLCRNNGQVRLLHEEFQRQGVPHELVGTGGLLDAPEVVDVLAVLRVLSDPTRSDSLMRLLAGARWRIGPGDLLALQDWARALAARRRSGVLAGLAEGHGGSRSADTSSAGPDQTEDRTAPDRSAQDRSAQDRAREELEQLLRTGGEDPSDGSSLIEALESLPPEDWRSPAGRSVSVEGRRRMALLAQELERLRGHLGEDLVSLLHQIERTLLLDLELASRPGRDLHESRAALDAFYQAAADYCATAPRLAASLELGRTVRWSETPEGSVPGGPLPAEHRYSVTSSATGVTAFLAWIEEADAQEGGLSAPPAPASDGAVQILTMHGAKGLEWDEVCLVGMNEGTFPSLRLDQWFSDLGALPWPLRGDSGYLPQLDTDGLEFFQDLDTQKATKTREEVVGAWQRFAEQNEDRLVAEERRLAYVALTRAKSLLVLASHWWKGTGKKPEQLSRFLQELVEPAAGTAPDGPGAAAESVPPIQWIRQDPVPDEDAENPHGTTLRAAWWPFDPLAVPPVQEFSTVEELQDLTFDAEGLEATLGRPPEVSRRAAVEAAAADVLAAIHAQERPDPSWTEDSSSDPAADGDGSESGGTEAAESAAAESDGSGLPDPADWAAEADLLLALARAATGRDTDAEMPRHVSASLLVGLADDAEAVRRQRLRPMPRRPRRAAREGTRFHEWVEHHYGDLGGSALFEDLDEDSFEDDATDREAEASQETLRENFRASPWFDRQPWAVEYPLETPLSTPAGDVVVRGRIDAVFHDPDPAPGQPAWELVDWKTGRVPRGRELEHKAVQLAVYRLAFARLHGIDPEEVATAFFYVATGETVRPPRQAGETELTALLARLADPRQQTDGAQDTGTEGMRGWAETP